MQQNVINVHLVWLHLYTFLPQPWSLPQKDPYPSAGYYWILHTHKITDHFIRHGRHWLCSLQKSTIIYSHTSNEIMCTMRIKLGLNRLSQHFEWVKTIWRIKLFCIQMSSFCNVSANFKKPDNLSLPIGTQCLHTLMGCCFFLTHSATILLF